MDFERRKYRVKVAPVRRFNRTAPQRDYSIRTVNRDYRVYGSKRDFHCLTTWWSDIVLTLADAYLPSIDLTWTDTCTSVDHYEVWRSTNGTTFALLGTSATRAYSDSAISLGTTYYYKVRAIQAVGTFSPWSNTVSAAPIGLKYIYTFTVSASNQLRLIDLTNPASPSLTGQVGVDLSNQIVYQMFMDKDYIYVGLADKIYIVKWSDNPQAPTLKGSIAWTFPGAFLVERSGANIYLYCSDTDGGTAVGVASWNITDPTSPVAIGTSRQSAGISNIVNPYRAMVMDASRNIYVAWCGNTQGAIWSKTTAAAAGTLGTTTVSTINTTVGGNKVYSQFIQNSILWLWSESLNTQGYPLPPVAPATYSALGVGTNVKPWWGVRGNQVFQANSPAGAGVPPIILSNFADPASVAQYATLGSANQGAPGFAALGNQLAFYNITDAKFYSYDITNLASPALLNTGGTSMNLGGPTYLCAYTPDFLDGRNGLIIT